MTKRRLLSAVAAGAILGTGATPAHAADEVVGPAQKTEVSAHGGWIAWLQDGKVVLRDPRGFESGKTLAAGVTATSVALGTDRRGKLIAVASGCGGGGCDLYRVPATGDAPSPLWEASSPGLDESQPAVWRGMLVFARKDGACSKLFVRRLGSKAASRLLRTACAEIRDIAVRGDRVAFTESVPAERGTRERAFTLSLTTASARVWRAVDASDAVPGLGQVALDSRHLYLARSPVAACGGACGIERFDLSRRSGDVVRALPPDRRVTSALARLSDGRIVYQPVSNVVGPYGTTLPAPLVRSEIDPFATQPHGLVPELSLELSPSGIVSRGTRVVATGRLTQTVVRVGTVVRVAPVANATVQLLRGYQVGFIPKGYGPVPDGWSPLGIPVTTDDGGEYAVPLEWTAGDLTLISARVVGEVTALEPSPTRGVTFTSPAGSS